MVKSFWYLISMGTKLLKPFLKCISSSIFHQRYPLEIFLLKYSSRLKEYYSLKVFMMTDGGNCHPISFLGACDSHEMIILYQESETNIASPGCKFLKTDNTRVSVVTDNSLLCSAPNI